MRWRLVAACLVAASGASVVERWAVRRAATAGCDGAVAAGHWAEAYDRCTRAGIHDPLSAVRAAEALMQMERRHEARALAEGLFAGPMGARARRLVARVHIREAHHELAEPLLREALAAHEAHGQLDEVARDALQLIRVLNRQRRFVEALRLADRGLTAAKAANDTGIYAFIEQALAETFWHIGHEAAAREAFLHASELQAEWPHDRAWTMVEYGVFVQEIGDVDTSLTILKSVLELAEHQRFDDVRIAALLSLSETERLRGHPSQAESYLRAGSVRPEDIGTVSYQRELGLLIAARGDLAGAEATLAHASQMNPDQDYAWTLAYERGRLAERMGAPRRAELHYRESIAIIERMRGQAGALELRPWILARRRGPYEALFTLLARGDRGRTLEALEIAERLSARTLRDSSVGLTRTSPPLRPIPTTATALAAAMPSLLDAPAAPPITGAAMLRVLAHREALVFFHAQDLWWRFRLANGRILALEPLAPATSALVKRWLAAPDDHEAALALGRALIPAADIHRTDIPLYLVANDELAPLPFAALRAPAGPLVALRPLVRLPGVSTLICRGPAPAPSLPPAVVGDARGDLPGARAEAERTAAALHAEAIVGAAATRARVLAAGDAPLLHLAVHAQRSLGGGALALADGELTGAEILRHQLAPPLVVLAGCATGVSPDAEAWSALSSAFLAAGSRAVVATLRSVADADAAALMARFYALGGATRPAAALTAAERELANLPVEKWAYFVVYGAASADDCTELPH